MTLGNNTAAQKHAEEELANGYISHWGMDGMKPYMRYTLAGGFNYEAENLSGPAILVKGVNYETSSPWQLLDEAETGLMESPGHRANILDKASQCHAGIQRQAREVRRAGLARDQQPDVGARAANQRIDLAQKESDGLQVGGIGQPAAIDQRVGFGFRQTGAELVTIHAVGDDGHGRPAAGHEAAGHGRILLRDHGDQVETPEQMRFIHL